MVRRQQQQQQQSEEIWRLSFTYRFSILIRLVLSACVLAAISLVENKGDDDDGFLINSNRSHPESAADTLITSGNPTHTHFQRTLFELWTSAEKIRGNQKLSLY